MSTRAAFYYFNDILQAVQHAQEIVADKTLADYRKHRTERRAVERLLQIITEASILLTDEDRALCGYADWREMRSLGNRLRHGYFTLDDEQIWLIVQDDLPILKAAIQRTLREHFPELSSE